MVKCKDLTEIQTYLNHTPNLEIFGEVVDNQSSDSYLSDLRLRRIGFVFQTFNLLATLSAYENVELPMIILGKLNLKQRKERTLKLLKSKILKMIRRDHSSNPEPP